MSWTFKKNGSAFEILLDSVEAATVIYSDQLGTNNNCFDKVANIHAKYVVFDRAHNVIVTGMKLEPRPGNSSGKCNFCALSHVCKVVLYC